MDRKTKAHNDLRTYYVYKFIYRRGVIKVKGRMDKHGWMASPDLLYPTKCACRTRKEAEDRGVELLGQQLAIAMNKVIRLRDRRDEVVRERSARGRRKA